MPCPMRSPCAPSSTASRSAGDGRSQEIGARSVVGLPKPRELVVGQPSGGHACMYTRRAWAWSGVETYAQPTISCSI